MDSLKNAPELPCPGCGYNVDAQVLEHMGRCPECGIDLTPLEIEPRSTLRARWQAAHSGLRERLLFRDPLAALSLLNIPVCYLMLWTPGCRVREPTSEVHAWSMVCSPVLSVILGIVVLARRSRWWTILLGLLNSALGLTALLVGLLVALLGRLVSD